MLAVKDNQKLLHEEIEDFFLTARKNDFHAVNHDYYEETHKGHGRVEVRRYWISNHLDTIAKPQRWSALKNIGMIEAERYINGKTSIETRYFITSIETDAKIFSNAVRKHWSVENQLHWVLDVTFREDDSRVRRDDASENLSVFSMLPLIVYEMKKLIKKK